VRRRQPVAVISAREATAKRLDNDYILSTRIFTYARQASEAQELTINTQICRLIFDWGRKVEEEVAAFRWS